MDNKAKTKTLPVGKNKAEAIGCSANEACGKAAMQYWEHRGQILVCFKLHFTPVNLNIYLARVSYCFPIDPRHNNSSGAVAPLCARHCLWLTTLHKPRTQWIEGSSFVRCDLELNLVHQVLTRHILCGRRGEQRLPSLCLSLALSGCQPTYQHLVKRKDNIRYCLFSEDRSLPAGTKHIHTNIYTRPKHRFFFFFNKGQVTMWQYICCRQCFLSFILHHRAAVIKVGLKWVCI